MLDTDSSLSDVLTTMRRESGRIVVKRTQDVEGYFEQNKAEFNSAPSWRPYASGKKDRPLRKVASIPNIVVEAWMKEGVNIFDPSPEMQKKVAEKLNSNEYSHLRTYPGRVGYKV